MRRVAPDAEWQLLALCRSESTDTFYPPDKARGNARRAYDRAAKQICELCPVLVACRRHAMITQEPHGIWGGLTPDERGALRAAAAGSVQAASN